MKLKEIERKIEQFNFSVFPQMLVQIKKVTADETAGAQDLSDIILTDQALTAKILSVANSAYYGFYGKVSTITQAIVALGFDSVKNIALGIAAYNSLSAFVKEPRIKQFWEHSLATGVCAELLAEKLGYTPTEEALVGGLIHDVGKLLLVQLYPEEYAEVERIISEQSDAYSHVVEASILGVNHGDVGGILSKKWGLPPQLERVVANHHKKEWGRCQLTDIVAFSDFMIQVLPSERDNEKIERMINLGSSVLSLKKESINNVMQILAERLEEYCRIFEIRIDNLMAYTTMVEEEYARIKKSASKKLSRKEEEVSILAEISNAMVAGRPQNELLQMVLEGIIRIEQADSAVLFSIDYDKSSVRGSIGLGKNAMCFASTYFLNLGEESSAIVRAARTGERQFLLKTESGEEISTPDLELLVELESASAYVLPLLVQGKAKSVLLVAWDKPQAEKSEKELQTLLLFANQATLILGAHGQGEAAADRKKRKRSNLLLDLD